MDSITNILKRIRESRILKESQDYEEMKVEELVKLAQEGDQLAYTTLVNTHKDFLSMMSSKYIMDKEDPDDIEQLATIAFWEAISSYNPEKNGDFRAYAGMIIKRRLTDELRKDSADKRKVNAEAQSLDEPIDSEEGGAIGDNVPSKSLSPEDYYIGEEGARELMKYMEDNFSEREINVVKLRIKGENMDTMMEETGMSYRQVENTLLRIKNKLADYLRARESKKIREARESNDSKEIEFTSVEKQILESVITKIDEKKASKKID